MVSGHSGHNVTQHLPEIAPTLAIALTSRDRTVDGVCLIGGVPLTIIKPKGINQCEWVIRHVCIPKENCFEREVGQLIAEKVGRPTRSRNSIYTPSRLRPQASGLETKTNGAGAYLIGARIDLIDAMTSQMRLAQLGATVLSGLTHSAQFASGDSGWSVVWVAENGGVDVAEQNRTYHAVVASPKTQQSTVAISHQLLQQASNSPDLERRLRLEITKGHANAFDAAGIAGTGVSNQPVGLLNIQTSAGIVPHRTNIVFDGRRCCPASGRFQYLPGRSPELTNMTYEIETCGRLLKVCDVARALSVAEHTVRIWLAEGRIRFVKLGRATRISEHELRRLVAEGFHQSQS